MTFEQLCKKALAIKKMDVAAARVFLYEEFDLKVRLLDEAFSSSADIEKRCQGLIILCRMFDGVDNVFDFLSGRQDVGATALMREGIELKTIRLLNLLIRLLIQMNDSQNIIEWKAGVYEVAYSAVGYLSRYLWLVEVSEEDFALAVDFLMEATTLIKKNARMLPVEIMLKVTAALRRFLDSNLTHRDRERLEQLFLAFLDMPECPVFIKQFSNWEQYNHLIAAASGLDFKFFDNKRQYFNLLVKVNMNACLYKMNQALDRSVNDFLECMKVLFSNEVIHLEYSHVQTLINLHVVQLRGKHRPKILHAFSNSDVRELILALTPELLCDQRVQELAQKFWRYFDEDSDDCLPILERAQLGIKNNQLLSQYGEVYGLWFKELFILMTKKEVCDPIYFKMRENQTLAEYKITDACWDRVYPLPTSEMFCEQDYIKTFLMEVNNVEAYLKILHHNLEDTSNIGLCARYIIDVILMSQSSVHMSQDLLDLMGTLNALIYSSVLEGGYLAKDLMAPLTVTLLLKPGEEKRSTEFVKIYVESFLHHKYDPNQVFEIYPNFQYFYQPLDVIDKLSELSKLVSKNDRIHLLRHLQTYLHEPTWRSMLSQLIIQESLTDVGLKPDDSIFEPFLSLDVRSLSDDVRSLVLTEVMVLNLEALYQKEAFGDQRASLAKLFERLYVALLFTRGQFNDGEALTADYFYQYIRICSLRMSGLLFNEALKGLMLKGIKLSQLMTKDQMKRLKALVPSSRVIECFDHGLMVNADKTLDVIKKQGKYLTSLPFYGPLSSESLRYVFNLIQKRGCHVPPEGGSDARIIWKAHQILGLDMSHHLAMPFMGLSAVQSVLLENHVDQKTVFAFKVLISIYPSSLYFLHQYGVQNEAVRLLLALYAEESLGVKDWHQYFLAKQVDMRAIERLKPLFKAKCETGLKYWWAHPKYVAQSAVEADYQKVLRPFIDHSQRLVLNELILNKFFRQIVAAHEAMESAPDRVKLDQLWHLHIIKHAVSQRKSVDIMMQLGALMSRLPKSMMHDFERPIFLQCHDDGLHIMRHGDEARVAFNVSDCFKILANCVAQGASREHVVLYAILMSGMDEAIEYERSLFNDMHPLYQIMGYYDQWVPGEKVQKIFQALERWQKDVASISEKHSDKIMKMVFDACGVTFFEQWGWLEKVISSEVLNECSWQNWEVKFSQKGCEFRCQKAIFCVESLDNIHDWHQVFWWISKGVKGQRTSHLRLSKSLGICPDLNQPMLISEQWIDHIISGTLLTVRDKIDTDGLGVLAQWLMVQHENGALKFHEVSEFIKYHLLSEYRGGETHLTGRMSQQGERWVLFVPILERNIIFDQENIGRQMIDIKNTLVKQLDLMRHSAQEKLVSFMSRHFPFLVYEYQWQGIHLVLNIGEFSKELQEATWRLWAPLDQEKLKWEIREHLSQTAPLLLLKQSFYGYELQFKAIADLLQLLNMPKVSGELLWYYQFGITVFQAPARYHVYDIHLNKAVSEDDMTTVLGNLESSGFSMFKVKQDWCANHHDLKIRIMLHQHETQLAQDLKSLRELEAGSDSWVQKDLTDWDVIMKCRFAQLMGESFSFGQLDEWLRGWSHTQLFLLCHRYSDAYLNLPGMLGDYIYQRIVLKPSLREEKSFEEWLEIIKNDLDERHQGGFVSELIQALGYTEMTMRLGT